MVRQDSTVILSISCPLVRKLRLRRIGVTDPSRVDQDLIDKKRNLSNPTSSSY
ncbi:hypothetical protein T4E_11374 [Trichinella pseudospiralis]|uniref:Uncharacterized protein n=1 Tax=Trichinella pseudospiralis TaxID=6337 RepID=A0A0V0Y5F0_TRIPS|nr:hypothetical protein T4E_11374 [Trichinella pseudospiralis]